MPSKYSPPATPPPGVPDDDPVYEDRAKPFLIKLSAAVAIVLLAFLALKPAIGMFERKQGLAAVEQAQALIKAGRPPEEVEPVIHEALRVSPGNPRVLRVAAQYALANAREEGLSWWRQLLASPEANREDRIEFLEHALALGRLDLSGAELASMFKVDPNDVSTLRLYLRHHEQNDDLLAAIAVARHWVARHLADEDGRLELGRLLIKHHSPQVRSEGQGMLQALATGNGPQRDAAINLLAAEHELSPGQRSAVIRALEGRSRGGLADRLRIATLRIQAEPEQRSELVAGMIRSVGGNPPMTNLVALATWLSDLGENQRLLDIVPFPRARLDPNLMSLHLTAVAALDRWTDIEPQLMSSSATGDAAQNHLLLAAAASHQGRPADAEQAFTLAIRAASGDQVKLRLIATQAERLRLDGAAIGAYEAMARISGQAAGATREVIRVIGRARDARGALDALRRASSQLPNTPALAVEEAYLRVLTNDGLAEARNQLAMLSAQNPSSRDIRIIYALAELQSQNAITARSLIEAEPIAWLSAPVRWQITHAAVLGASGDGDGARQWAKRIDVSRIKPQELQLIKYWIQ